MSNFSDHVRNPFVKSYLVPDKNCLLHLVHIVLNISFISSLSPFIFSGCVFVEKMGCLVLTLDRGDCTLDIINQLLCSYVSYKLMVKARFLVKLGFDSFSLEF